ncbi:Hypothetical predicted protein [Mytilus galloprovincialis]|uniref:Uncharacterized protein n=1 Tax=Mytilus galloprovincialis TaxID=29158 RepID=A0A8B6DRK1_MYTGA|nr:Hypothetical predicted protein [Mytilus galloprovincialis]
MIYVDFLAVLAVVFVPQVFSRSQPLLPWLPNVCRPCQKGACSGCEDYRGNCLPNGCSYKDECKESGSTWIDDCITFICNGAFISTLEAKCMDYDGSCVGHDELMSDPLCQCNVWRSSFGGMAKALIDCQ